MKGKPQNKSLASLMLAGLGVFLLLKYAGIVSASYGEIYGYAFCIYGLAAVYILSGTGSKGSLFSAGVMFIAGAALLVPEYYEILSPVKLFLPTIFFAAGTGFALLFLDDFREFVFLFIAAILLSAGVISAIYFDLIASIQFANDIARVIFYYWPVIFVLIGFGVILNRYRL